MISNRVIGSADVPARQTFRVVLAVWSVMAAFATVRYGTVIGWSLFATGWLTIASAARIRRPWPTLRVAEQGREGGATLVETALILPLVLILFMGIVDFGTAIADFNSLRQGDREGVRRGVVGDVSGASACPIAGVVPSADTAALVCLTKDKTRLDAAVTQVAVVLDMSYTEGDALILCTQYPLHSRTGFFGGLLDGRMVHSQVDMRIEKASLDIQAFAEPGAGDWAWCG